MYCLINISSNRTASAYLVDKYYEAQHSFRLVYIFFNVRQELRNGVYNSELTKVDCYPI